MTNNIILGYGILGKELVKQTGWDCLSKDANQNFDFKKINSYDKIISSYDTVINCIGNTDTYSDNQKEHWDINYKGVSDLLFITSGLVSKAKSYIDFNPVPTLLIPLAPLFIS